MADTHFVIAIRNKVPVLVSGPPCIVTDNSDYTIELLPDAQWEGFEAKTVYYAFDLAGAIVHPITGNHDTVPKMKKAGVVYIGVSAGDIRTTRPLAVKVASSIRDMAGVEIPEPEPEVYDRIMEMINNHEVRIKRLEVGGTGGGGSGGGIAFVPGHALELTEDGTLNVRTTNEAEADNTLPITSAGVNTIVGNIGALLDTI